VTRRVVLALLETLPWAPPGIPPAAWRAAMAEDMVDLIAPLAEADAGIAVAVEDRALAQAVAWPGMPVYELRVATVRAALAAAAADGYDQAAILAPDAPDLPALLIGKLLRPLGSRPVAFAPAADGGALGLASRLPAPDWLPDLPLEEITGVRLRERAPAPGDVAAAPGWHRQRGPADLARLDPALEGWEATRVVLQGAPRRPA
jgi:hypothetical protein